MEATRGDGIGWKARTIKLNLLGDCELDVSRPRGQVEDEHVEPAPVYLVEELLQRLLDEQAAPCDGRVGGDEIAH